MDPLKLKLPIIDLCKDDLKPGTVYWDRTRSEVLRALEEYGCFEALFDKVPLNLHKAFFNSLEELFDLPIETKMKNTSDQPYKGYVGSNPILRPLFEGLGIDDVTLEATQSFTNLMWPHGNSNFCETVQSFCKHVLELDQIVKKMVFESLGVHKYYDSCIKSTQYSLRVMKYKRPQTNETTLGADIHTDKSFTTILHQNQVNGLEIKTKDGKWITVTPSASSFIVMIGETFHAWSNGRLYCPYHRVMMSGNSKERYSTGLFSFGKNILEVPEELVDEEHPLMFKPFDTMGLLSFYFAQGQGRTNTAYTVKAYCGV